MAKGRPEEAALLCERIRRPVSLAPHRHPAEMRNRPQRQVGAGRFERLGHALEIPTNTGDAFNKVLTVATEPVGYSEFP